jgi:hypothetical protein
VFAHGCIVRVFGAGVKHLFVKILFVLVDEFFEING